MQAATKSKISELQAIMTKMSLEVCCVAALPEFGVKWREVSKAVRNARLPMTSASVARVICRHVAKSLDAEDVEDIVARLRLKLVASQTRTWHLIRLEGQVSEEPAATMVRCLPGRVRTALREGRAKHMRSEVQTIMMGDLVYLSVRLVSAAREGSTLFAAVPPGQGSALVSSLGAATVLRAVVQGLGYTSYVDAHLHGGDIASLLRVNAGCARLGSPPPYRPRPAPAKHGLDYTYKVYDQEYLDEVMGPDPPHLTHLSITTTKSFFDPSRLDKQMRLSVGLRCGDVARGLRSWAAAGALAPGSRLLELYRTLSANVITHDGNDDD